MGIKNIVSIVVVIIGIILLAWCAVAFKFLFEYELRTAKSLGKVLTKLLKKSTRERSDRFYALLAIIGTGLLIGGGYGIIQNNETGA